MITSFDTSAIAPGGGEKSGSGAGWLVALLVVAVIGYVIYREVNKPKPEEPRQEEPAQ